MVGAALAFFRLRSTRSKNWLRKVDQWSCNDVGTLVEEGPKSWGHCPRSSNQPALRVWTRILPGGLTQGCAGKMVGAA